MSNRFWPTVSAIFCGLWLVALVIPAPAIKPYLEYEHTPSDLGFPNVEVSIPTKDGWNLAGWFLPSRTDTALASIIFCYGDAGNMGFMLGHADAFTNKGFDVLLFDYRGFGQSDPFTIDPDRIIYPEFLSDVEAAVDHIVSTRPGKVVIFGQSMGAVLAMAASAGRDDVVAVVAEGAYATTSEALEIINRQEGDSGRRFKPSDEYPDSAQPLNAAAKLGDTALFVLTGSEDTIATPEVASRLFAACNSDSKSLWIATGAGHGDIAPIYTDTYVDMVCAFLTKVLQRGAPAPAK